MRSISPHLGKGRGRARSAPPAEAWCEGEGESGVTDSQQGRRMRAAPSHTLGHKGRCQGRHKYCDQTQRQPGTEAGPAVAGPPTLSLGF